MDKVREFRARATECREQASRAQAGRDGEYYLNLARTWDKLADERLKFFVIPYPELEERQITGATSMSEVSKTFWGEMSACEHFVQIYEADHEFLETLSVFFANALRLGNSAVAIATAAHSHELERRLAALGFDIEAAKRADQLILLNAEQVISQFMVDGWPDEKKFTNVVQAILSRACSDGRKVSAFGEMVALMWAKGYCEATVRLEHLWQQICERESFTLFCAYPKSGFTETPIESMARVCEAHSKVFAA